MKKIYEKPIIEIEEFELEDIITLETSALGNSDTVGWGDIH